MGYVQNKFLGNLPKNIIKVRIIFYYIFIYLYMNTKSMKKAIRNTFQVFYTVLLLILKGFVISQLFNWYISPIFSISPITFPIGIGIAAMLAVANHLPIWHFEDYNEEFNYNITIGVKPIILYFIGWIFHFFV